MIFSKHRYIDELLPDAWLYDDRIVYIDKDERVYGASGFVVHGQPMTNLSPEHLALWRGAAMAMLNALDTSAHVDFYWAVDNDYSHFISGHQSKRDRCTSKIALHLLDDRIKKLEERQIRNELLYRKLYVFVNLEPQPTKIRMDEEFRRRINLSEDHKMLLSEWKAAKQKLDQMVEMVRHPFETAGMNTVLLKNAEYKRIFKKMLAPLRSRLQVQDPPVKSRCHLWSETVVSDIERKSSFLHFDDHYHAFLSMTNLPQETRSGFLHHLFSIPHPNYALKVTFRTSDKQKEIKDLQSAFGSKKSVIKGKSAAGGNVDIAMDEQANELEQEIRVLERTPQQIFHAQVLMHQWSADENELIKQVDDAILRFGYCNGSQAIVEKLAAPEALRACLPGWTRENRLDRFHVLKSVNTADFIPAHTEFIGTGRPQMIFPNPQNGLMAAHVFTEQRPFHNLVIGETGGGKTFLLNSMITQLVAQGLKSLTVISTKDEFRPLMAMYGGITVTFTEDSKFFLNPCAIAGEYPTEQELDGMTPIFETIFGDEPKASERKIRKSRILKAATIAFKQNGSKTRTRHFRKAFRDGWEHDNQEELNRLAMILEPYCQGGVYGEHFDSDTREPLDLSNPFKFFNFANIATNEDLSAVMMMALSTAENLRLAKMPKHWQKASILDECWKYINNSAGKDYIENQLRVNRAYNCAVFLSSQNIEDFLKSVISHVIFGNCHNFFLLRTKNHTAIAALQKELSLTSELAERFTVMEDPAEVGYSSFVYVHRGEAKHIAGEAINHIGKEEALLYSTSSNVSQLRDYHLARSDDPWATVCRMAEMTKEELEQERARLFENQ